MIKEQKELINAVKDDVKEAYDVMYRIAHKGINTSSYSNIVEVEQNETCNYSRAKALLRMHKDNFKRDIAFAEEQMAEEGRKLSDIIYSNNTYQEVIDDAKARLASICIVAYKLSAEDVTILE